MTSSKKPTKPRRIFGSIRSQLALGFGLMLFLASVIAVIGYQSLESLRTNVQTTLEEANRIRRLSLEIETEFLQARQAELNFLASWRDLGFEAAQTEYASANKFHLEQARVKLNEIDALVQNSGDAELQAILEDTARLAPLLDTYDTAFQAVVAAIEQRAQPDGQEITMYTTLNQLEAIVTSLPDPKFLELILQIRADEQAYLNTGQQQYYDNLRLSILDFTELVQNSSQSSLPQETEPDPASVSDPQEEIVQVPVSELLKLIGIYQVNLTELAVLEGNIDVNSTVFREVTGEINQVTSHILQEGDAGFTRARDQLQIVSDQTKLALLVISALALGLGSLTAFVLARRIIGPLNELSQAAQKLGQGDLTQTVQVRGGDELVTLGESFNQMAGQLADILENLEGRVAERTTDLELSRQQSENRARELQSIGEISNIINSEQKLENLLPLISRLVSERFGFYHTGIFLIDETNQFAVLHAANSAGGKNMVARGHRLEVGGIGIVGNVAKAGRSRIALDVGLDSVFFNNPDLPNTRSEMALPLKVRDRIVGVLDVQSEKPGAFTEDDARTLSILADQVAIAIENARLFTQTQQALNEAQALYRHNLQEGWLTFSREEASIGYHQSLKGGTKLKTPIETDEIRQAMNRGNVLVFNSGETEHEPSIVVPIKLRGQIIGALNIKSPTNDRRWTNDEINLAETISERLSIALENARLIQESQRQVIKEQTISEVTGKIGASINLKNVLQTAVEELGRAMPGSEVLIKFQNDESNGNGK